MHARPADAADVALIADVLAEAFADDPLLVWLFPDAERRPALLSRYFSTVARTFYLPQHETYLADGGAALWLPPGKTAALPALTFAHLLWQMWRAQGFAGLNRARLLSDELQRNHPAELHFYLHAIGVRKSRQGQGVGSALLSHVTARCDAAKALAYLENSNPRNTPLYERHGFRVVGQWVAPQGPPLWFMRRRPEGG